MAMMNIGDAARAAGITPKMIRHYESLGLIPAADRTDAGYRLYGERELAMLRFIRQGRSLGFAIPQIGELMQYWRDDARHSRAVKQVALEQLEELEARQREIDQMRATLSRLVTDCAGDEQSHCAILDSLADPAETPAPQAARGLKVVRAGDKAGRPHARRGAAKRGHAAARPEAPAHAGLVAWAQTLWRPES
jgi:Cu(I)-responsive transcriptional regulator